MRKMFFNMAAIYFVTVGAAYLFSEAYSSFINLTEERSSRRIIKEVRDAPMSDWILYERIAPEEEVVIKGDLLWFLSYFRVHQGEVDIYWVDTLRCRPIGTNILYGYVQEFKTNTNITQPAPENVGKLKTSRWLYDTPLKNAAEGQCVIDSKIEIRIPVLDTIIIKKQHLRSSPFLLLDEYPREGDL